MEYSGWQNCSTGPCNEVDRFISNYLKILGQNARLYLKQKCGIEQIICKLRKYFDQMLKEVVFPIMGKTP